MNSFTLTAIGNLARNPELVSKGERSYLKTASSGIWLRVGFRP